VFITFGAVFGNNKDADEVLLVSSTHFGACNTSQPVGGPSSVSTVVPYRERAPESW
jgi:hypothetical protein